jgi:N-acetylglucosamine-6-sulfatase
MYYHYWTAGQPVRPSHYGIRTREHKLIYYYGLVRDEGHRPEDCWEFYDLVRDPYELTNCYSDPRYTARIAELRDHLGTLRRQCGDTADPVTNYPV